MPKIYFLNGPNANLYGLDAKGTYGTESFPQIKERCENTPRTIGIDLDFRQSNHEGELIDWIQEARQKADGLIINGAGLTYTSIAILDALLAFEKPIIEVHMSNIYKREPFRHHSFISKAATGIVAGLGPLGYELAITAIAQVLEGREEGMSRDALIFYSEFDDPAAWKKTLTAELPDLDFHTDPRRGRSGDVHYALAWKPPKGFFARFPNLKLVTNLGAGVDSLVGRDDLPDVPISRLSDDGMVQLMTFLRAVLGHPLCARHPHLRARATRAANGNTCIRARCPTSASACWGLGELGAPGGARRWHERASTCAAGAAARRPSTA